MSTPNSCRREETGFCQPDRTILVKQPPQTLPTTAENMETNEKQTMSEKQFMRDHSLYSGVSSWLFAISGATNLSVLGALSQKVFQAIEKGLPVFKSNDAAIKPVFANKKFNQFALAMTAFGGACMAFSNWLESKKVVTEWQLGAGKMQRKMNIAEQENKQNVIATSSPSAALTSQALATGTPPAETKNWAALVQPKPGSIEQLAARFGHG